MPRKIITLDKLGDVGLIRDVEQHDLPLNAMTAAQNAVFYQGYAERVKGSTVFFTPSIQPRFLYPVQYTTSLYWLYFGLTKAYVYNGATHTDITNAGGNFSGSATDRWVGTSLSGIPVFTNGVDVPQQWDPSSPTGALVDLQNWPSAWTCQSIRAFDVFLVALRVSKSGDDFPHLVQFSDAAEPGAVPSSWIAGATTKAGGKDLSSTPGYIVDGGPLRDLFIIYKEHSTWGMAFIGGSLVMDFFPILPNSGMLAKHCFTEFQGQHFVLTDADVIVHDGQRFNSAIDVRNRRALFDEMDQDNYDNSFVVHDESRQEIWVCVPESGATYPTLAWVWNWKTNTWGVRELPSVVHMHYGLSNISDPHTYDSLAAEGYTYDTIPGTYDDRGFSPISRSVVGSTFSAGGAIQMLDFNQGYVERGTDKMTCYTQRTGINFSGNHRVTTVFEVYPIMDATGPVEISIGRQAHPNADVVWEQTKTFNPNSQEKVNFKVSGVYHGFRIRSTEDVNWRLRSMKFVVRHGGIR